MPVSKHEQSVLTNYADGAVVQDGHRRVLRYLHSIGMVTFGYSVRNNTVLKTAKATGRGLSAMPEAPSTLAARIRRMLCVFVRLSRI